MPRKPREEVAGGVFHRRDIFLDPHDCELYLSLLAGVIKRTGWRCLGYCLMVNHVHLLIETPQPNLGRGMQRLQSTYAQRFNQRYGRCGHVFQGRYGSKRMLDDVHLWTAARYLARNPVEALLCDRPEHWPWSSYAHVMSDIRPAWLDAARLLFYFDTPGGVEAARARFASLVEVA